ncbi:MAG: adenylyltransferase/cytidyltransferase family protein [Planctomycetes bacterium]|nr:adenylyltransferase/cytidyltransferase family protein [Planctomycetota bacterium]
MANAAPPTRRALYIGRFQLFHIGHLDVLRQIDAAPDIDEILIALGSPQYDHRTKSPEAPWSVNPFTVEERLEMIAGALHGQLRKPYGIHPIPDFHDYERWHAHIVERLPAFVVLYSSDSRERAFFAARGTEARTFERRFSFHAGKLRERIREGAEYRSALPPATLAVLDRIGAADRMKELHARDLAHRPT